MVFALLGALLLIVVLVVVIAVIYGVIIYNGFVELRNNIKKAWANIDVLLKQRSDELPKLVDTVKGYMKHEKSLLTELTAARTAFLKAKSVSAKAKADQDTSAALKSIFAVAENYPNLKANENFIQLQQRISGIENEIADRREFLNESVNNYNIRQQSFPDMIIAGMMHLTEEQMFAVSEQEKKDVKIEL